MNSRSNVRRLPCSGRTLHEMVCWKAPAEGMRQVQNLS